MRLTITQTPAFAAEWRSNRLTDADLRMLENVLMENPQAGKPMQGTSGLRKIRFAPRSWHVGKSGALRICYASFPRLANILLVTLFAKNEKDNLSRDERNKIAKMLERYESSFK